MFQVDFNMCYKMNMMYTYAQILHAEHFFNELRWQISNIDCVKV